MRVEKKKKNMVSSPYSIVFKEKVMRRGADKPQKRPAGLLGGFANMKAHIAALPPATALAWKVPVRLLHETFNAVEILPPHVAGKIVWADLLLLPAKREL